MIDITNRIQEPRDIGQYACGIYVDFKKAFDTVSIVWNPQLQMGGGVMEISKYRIIGAEKI